MLRFYGSLFFASAEAFEEQLPHPTKDTAPTVVIVDLRGQPDLDSRTLNMLTGYAMTLREHDCFFMLAEVGEAVRETLERAGKLGEIGSENLFRATEQVDQSFLEAANEAKNRLATRR